MFVTFLILVACWQLFINYCYCSGWRTLSFVTTSYDLNKFNKRKMCRTFHLSYFDNVCSQWNKVVLGKETGLTITVCF